MIIVETQRAKPFLKWVGGKSKQLPQLLQLLPLEFDNYYEPFVGGGALYFALPGMHVATLNDINEHLITAYRQLRDDVESVIAYLKKLESAYFSCANEKRKEYFLARREEYNALNDSSIRKTALLIFLNKTCFNGLYRENRSGKFNVPFGKHNNPTICNEDNLRQVAIKLEGAKLVSGSYHEALRFAQKGDFIYFDPPYFPLNATSNFTSYHAGDFAENDQVQLRDAFAELDSRGCYVMLSNSDTPFIADLYKDFRQEKIYAARSINSVGTGRGTITELAILNY